MVNLAAEVSTERSSHTRPDLTLVPSPGCMYWLALWEYIQIIMTLLYVALCIGFEWVHLYGIWSLWRSRYFRNTNICDNFFDCLNGRSLTAHVRLNKPNLKPYTDPCDERLTVSCVHIYSEPPNNGHPPFGPTILSFIPRLSCFSCNIIVKIAKVCLRGMCARIVLVVCISQYFFSCIVAGEWLSWLFGGLEEKCKQQKWCYIHN